MVAQGDRQVVPFDPRHSCTEGQAGEFFLEVPDLGVVRRGPKLFSELEKMPALAFAGLKSGFNQVFEDATRAALLTTGELLYAAVGRYRRRCSGARL